MKNKTQLSVRPVRKSKKPGYPSWQEPNPLEQPYSQPYPFTQKAINWLAASGLCGALFLMPEGEGVLKREDKIETMDLDTLVNPFPFNKMGLPFHTVSYGTGLPERITGEEAKAVIDSVFRTEGFCLEKKAVKAADGLVELTGYDPQKNIGYIWIGWERMGDDMAIPWQKRKDLKVGNKKPVKPKRQADSRIDGYSKSIKTMHEAFSKDKYASMSRKRFAQQLKAMIDAGQPDWKESYRFLYYEYILNERLENDEKYHAGKFPVLTKYLKDILEIKNEEKRNKELYKAMYVLSKQKVYQDWISAVLISAVNGNKPAPKLKRLVHLQNAYREFGYFDTDKQAQIKQLIIEGKRKWKTAEEQLNIWEDEKRISLDEARALEGDAYQNNRFVALISQQDERMTYNVTKEYLAREKKMEWEFYKKNNPGADSLKYEEMRNARGHLNYGKVKEDVLKNLEKQVLEYILWAKQQRGY